MNGLNGAAFLFATLLLPLLAGDAYAKTLEKKPLPAPKVLRHRAPGPKTLAPDKRLGGHSDSCRSRKGVLDQEQGRLDDYKADLTSVNAEISQLQRRLRELTNRSKHLQGQLRAQKGRVTRIEESYEQECKGTESCSHYERTALSLERRSEQLEQNLDEASDEITKTRSDISSLTRQIKPLQSRYQGKRCNRLIPGKTSQATIDQCSTIFSKWNRLQSALNRHNSRLSQLRAEYERTITQLTSLETRAGHLNATISRNCRGNQKTLKVLNVRKRQRVRDRAHSLGEELDRLIEDVSRLRKLEITIQSR